MLKSTLAPLAIAPGWRAGHSERLTRCVRPSYRLGLLASGQACLLWLSGRHHPGVHALGTVAAAPGEREGAPAVEVDLRLLAEPVPRPLLLADPALAAAEVLRMPAGSNPSYLTPAQFAALERYL
ncbi:hypothetical protein NUM3379_19690 [Kineococcus sp. NUM-3379]